MIRIRKTLALTLGAAVALPALSSLAAEPTEETAKVEITAEDAQQDDILLVIDLPIVIADAHDAGVEEDELIEVVTTAADSGLSASVTADIVAAETETTKTKGKRKGLSWFVKLQLAEGVPPQEIAAKIKERKDEIKEMTPEERAAFELRVTELREQNKARKLALHDMRKELRAQGKDIELLALEIHVARKAALHERKGELEASHKAFKEAHRDHHDAREEHREAREDLEDSREEHHEAHEDVVDARKDLKAADDPDERKAAAKDLRDAKKDAHESKKDAHEAKKDAHEAKKDAHEAKKDMRDAKAAKGKKGG